MAVEKSGAIDFNKAFGTPKTQQSKQDKPPAQYWLNIGYETEFQGEEGIETRFISLPMGIPVDTMDDLKTNSRNQVFAQFQAARNDLKEQILEVAKTLAPGEERTLNLTIQLRHINEELPEVNADNNPMVRKIAL